MARPKDLLRASRKAASVQGIWFPVPQPRSFGRRHGVVSGHGPVRRLPSMSHAVKPFLEEGRCLPWADSDEICPVSPSSLHRHCEPLPWKPGHHCARGPPSIRAGTKPVTQYRIRLWASLGSADEEPHLRIGLPTADPGVKRVLAPACAVFLSFASPAAAVPLLLPQIAFSRAPAGGVPVLRYFQSSINSLRASATIPIRRIRELPCPYFRSYHRLNSLCGW